MDAATLERLDALDDAAARVAFTRCCGASRWVDAMVAERPFGNVEALSEAADAIWSTMERADILQAFEHHPRIGADIDALREKFAATSAWSGQEQAAVASADEDVLERLRDGNVAYEARYGHIFIVCATGKTAAEMLALLEARLDNEPADELRIAAEEQRKITQIRLDKLEL